MTNIGAAGPVLHARSAHAFTAVQTSARGRFAFQIHSSNKVHTLDVFVQVVLRIKPETSAGDPLDAAWANGDERSFRKPFYSNRGL